MDFGAWPHGEHVSDAGLLAASDAAIWGYALQHEAVIITKDDDFRGFSMFAESAPAVVWIRVGNSSRRELLDWLEPVFDQVAEMIEAGEQLIELR